LISLDEYLNTSYKPDMDFVDGALVRRNVGTQRHGLLQASVAGFLGGQEKSHRIRVFTSSRLRIDAQGRHRIPDVMVLETPYKKGKVVQDVPAIVIEIKSPDDTFDDILDRCFDYERLSAGNIVVMDPDRRMAWRFREASLQLMTGTSISLHLPRQQSTIDFPFAELFAELDED
jgi:Uma2 family endonuclease